MSPRWGSGARGRGVPGEEGGQTGAAKGRLATVAPSDGEGDGEAAAA
jgi:hypothetical protein